MTTNKKLVLTLFSKQSPFAKMCGLEKSDFLHCVMLFDGLVNGTSAFDKKYSVVMADLAQTNKRQQQQFFDFYKDHCLKNSIFIVVYDEDNKTDLIPRVLEEATILIPHPVEESGILKIAEDCLSKFQEVYSDEPDISEFMIAIKILEKGKFTFKRLDEAKSLSSALATLCPNISEAAIGLLELMINCIEHGNLEITFDEKGTLLKEGKWHQEVEHRLTLPKYSYRNAHIQFERKTNKIEFILSDEGSGFNANLYLPDKMDKEPDDRVFSFHGRGIKVAAELCFDQLEYLGKGNQVKATIDL